MKRLIDSTQLVNDLDFAGKNLLNPGNISLSASTKIQPLGYYYLWPFWSQGAAPNPNDCLGLTNPFINGILWRANWERLAQTGPTPTFDYLDACISASDTNNKDCAFQIRAGTSSPPWLFNPPISAPNFLSGTPPSKCSVPWDPIVQGQWQSFQVAMAARYKSHPRLKYVLIQGVGRQSETFFATDDINEFPFASAIATGPPFFYPDVHTAWRAGAQWYIDMMAAVWAPVKIVLTTGNPFSIANNGPADLAWAYSYGDSTYKGLFGARGNDLTKGGPNPTDTSAVVVGQIGPHCIATGFQFGNAQASSDPNPPNQFNGALIRANGYGAHFVECFNSDVDPARTDPTGPTAQVMQANFAAMSGIESAGFVVQTDDPRLSDPRTMLSGSVVDASVSPTAGIQQSKLNLNGVIPPGWLGTGDNQAAKGSLVQFQSQKGSNNGYAPLNSAGTLDISKLPSTGPGAGRVTIVGIAMPDVFNVPVPQVTINGSLSVAWNPVPDKSWLGINGIIGPGIPLEPTFVTLGIPLSLVPPLDGSIVQSGVFPPSQLPVMKGMGVGHAGGLVPDPGMAGEPTDYLARDGSYKSVNSHLNYQPSIKAVQLTLLSWYQGKAYVKIFCLQKNVALFYLARAIGPSPGAVAYIPIANPSTLLFVPGTNISAYAARAGYNNSPIASFLVPASPTV